MGNDESHRSCLCWLLPIFSWSVNDSVISFFVQAADREDFWIKEDGACSKQPSILDRQQRKGVA